MMDTIGITKGILYLIFRPGGVDRPCFGILELQVDGDILRYDTVDLESESSRRKFLAGLAELSDFIGAEIEDGMDALVRRIKQQTNNTCGAERTVMYEHIK